MREIYLLICLLILCSFTSSGVIVSKASWYGDNHHGKLTASGERYDMNKYTAAHKTLKFGTEIRVTNVKNDKSIIVRVNDRGPFVKGRDLDLSKIAFKQLATLKSGVINIKYEIIK